MYIVKKQEPTWNGLFRKLIIESDIQGDWQNARRQVGFAPQSGSGCGSVGRAVASDSRGLELYYYIILIVLKTRK